MGVDLEKAATSRLRVLLAFSLVVAVVAGFLAMIVVPVVVLVRGSSDMLVYVQAVGFGLLALETWAVARRKHRAIDRGQLLVFSGLATSVVGQLLTNPDHPRLLDLVFGYLSLVLICVGFGLMLVSYVGNRRAAKRREQRALMARLTRALRWRSPTFTALATAETLAVDSIARSIPPAPHASDST